MKQQPASSRSVEARRQRARRTALWVALIAAAVYFGFIALGVFSQ